MRNENDCDHHLLDSTHSIAMMGAEVAVVVVIEPRKKQKVETTTSHTLPTPVSAITGQKEHHAGNKHKEETIQVIDLTNPKKER